jgi:DNA mismatch endonuclease (patch repair protein)
MDIFTPEKRSDIMSRIPSSGTVPELRLFEAVRQVVGGRRRLYKNARHILGTPDIFIPSLALALFVDGCFFHGCPQHGHIPKTNSEFWSAKILRNQRRDRRYRRRLRGQGYSVWGFWEHELRPRSIAAAIRRIELACRRQLASLDAR